ncbi:MAG: 1-deoxy-D-xylulose-5-phosphate synthase [Elusimicrobiota bacterium]|jgi:1-deoxy-D-xylulose-5-phosphate synthase|nr:1-deoxy-D-xylulose-5-phosphate synthase [Elusimicrobiota bacterium]
MYLENINNPADLKKLQRENLPALAKEIRQHIIECVSKNGGHLASCLGVVDLTIALHYVYNCPKDKIIWDVGHQAYAHKILTQRRDKFHTIRLYKGLSGFPKRSESEYDPFGAGHASTAISAALGFAVARDLQKENFDIIAVIGDGSMTGGLTFEGLQNAGYLKKNMLVILNDNEMFISQKVGAVAGYLAKLLTVGIINKAQETVMKTISRFHGLGSPVGKLFRRVKVMLFPGMLFEELGFTYIGPIQGHDINDLIKVISNIKDMTGPVVLHIITKKGKGYKPAEENPIKFHGIGKFDIETGQSLSQSKISYTDIFADSLIKIAKTNNKIIAITAAMPMGTGLDKFAKEFPDRYFDVGIAEGHAVTFAAGMAACGMQPICAIYSTFMQRALDNIIHDTALQNLPVVFALDRAGLVGEDGATHHGVFDISYLKYIPNLIIMSPADENEFQHMLKTAFNSGKPCVIRYPRGSGPAASMDMYQSILQIGKAKILIEGSDICLLAIGSQVDTCIKAAKILKENNISAQVINMRFLKPLDEEIIKETISKINKFITVEENVLSGGFGESIKSILCNTPAIVKSIGLPDDFIEHGDINILKEKYGLTPANIVKTAMSMF